MARVEAYEGKSDPEKVFWLEFVQADDDLCVILVDANGAPVHGGGLLATFEIDDGKLALHRVGSISANIGVALADDGRIKLI